jgi:hypothetical protein
MNATLLVSIVDVTKRALKVSSATMARAIPAALLNTVIEKAVKIFSRIEEAARCAISIGRASRPRASTHPR